MSLDTADSIAKAAKKTAVDLGWNQWQSLTSPAGRTTAIVDIETLVILSLAIVQHERRLGDLVASWSAEGARYLSVGRMRKIATRFGSAGASALGAYAALIGDHRWIADATSHALSVRGKRAAPLQFTGEAALMLRLRAAFGVGPKADLLTVLIGLHGATATVRDLTHATTYVARAVRQSLDEMSSAGIVERIDDSVALYRADPAEWRTFLHLAPAGSTRSWYPWADIGALLVAVIEWEAEAKAKEWSEYVTAARATDLIESHHTPALAKLQPRSRRRVVKEGNDLGPLAALVTDLAELVKNAHAPR
ncbi:MAG: hypothetical protein ABIS00_03765 [Gemmatimonadales bacterium]